MQAPLLPQQVQPSVLPQQLLHQTMLPLHVLRRLLLSHPSHTPPLLMRLPPLQFPLHLHLQLLPIPRLPAPLQRLLLYQYQWAPLPKAPLHLEFHLQQPAQPWRLVHLR